MLSAFILLAFFLLYLAQPRLEGNEMRVVDLRQTPTEIYDK